MQKASDNHPVICCNKTMAIFLNLLQLWQHQQHVWHDEQATLPAHKLACSDCGLNIDVPQLLPGEAAECPRCHHSLIEVERNPFHAPMAFACASFIMIMLVYTQLFLQIDLSGMHAFLTLPEMVQVTILQDFGFLATVMFVLTFGTPVLFTLLCLYVYAALKWQQPFPCMLYATRVMVRLRSWMMVDVFFIATLVAYIKISGMAQVHFGAAFWLMFVLAVLLIRTAQSVPEHWIYRQIQLLLGRDPVALVKTPFTICCSNCLYEQPRNRHTCAVCGAYLYSRRPLSLQISMSFLLTAVMLYLPANLFPMMLTSSPLGSTASTILDGIEYMWKSGDKVIALIIFSASMAIPVLKILAMFILLYSAGVKPLFSGMALSRLYRFTESIGRWSMIDIFVVIILMSAFRSPLAKVTAGPATVYFCLVVLLTMLSARYFDPRLIWDKIAARYHHPID